METVWFLLQNYALQVTSVDPMQYQLTHFYIKGAIFVLAGVNLFIRFLASKTVIIQWVIFDALMKMLFLLLFL